MAERFQCFKIVIYDDNDDYDDDNEWTRWLDELLMVLVYVLQAYSWWKFTVTMTITLNWFGYVSDLCNTQLRSGKFKTGTWQVHFVSVVINFPQIFTSIFAIN